VVLPPNPPAYRQAGLKGGSETKGFRTPFRGQGVKKGERNEKVLVVNKLKIRNIGH